MSRTLVSLRQAIVADAPFLLELWRDSLRRADDQDLVADLEGVIKAAAQSPEQRLLVAEHDGHQAGAVLLTVSTLSPINLEPAIWSLAPHVALGYRRKGVGRTLMESAVAFAEELGIQHVSTAAASGSRDGNRFLARLGLGPQATLRVAATPIVRARLEAQRPASQRNGATRQLGQVLAARRSLRRSQDASAG